MLANVGNLMQKSLPNPNIDDYSKRGRAFEKIPERTPGSYLERPWQLP